MKTEAEIRAEIDDEKIVEAMLKSASRHVPILRTLEHEPTRKAFKAALAVACQHLVPQARAEALDDAARLVYEKKSTLGSINLAEAILALKDT